MYSVCSVQPGSRILFPEAYKIVDGPVVGFFSVIRKITGRQFSDFPVVFQAVTAYGMLAAWVCAIAIIVVSVFLAFHAWLCLFVPLFQVELREIKVRIWYVYFQAGNLAITVKVKFYGPLRQERHVPEVDQEGIF